MVLVAVGRWRKGGLWTTMLAVQMIYACCFFLAITAVYNLSTMFDIFRFVWSNGSNTGVAIVLVIDLVIVYGVLKFLWYEMIIVCSAIGSVLYLLDIFYRAIDRWLRWYLPRREHPVPNDMERVAYLQSSSRKTFKFNPVIVCDVDQVDDPFWPNHASIVHCAEVRWHSVFWREIILWRVSLLNGCQRELANFHHVYPFNIQIPFVGSDDHQFKCFQSRGVVFMLEFDEFDPPMLTVFDMRFGKSVLYDEISQLDIANSNHVLLIRLSHRLLDSSGRLQGWRIRLLYERLEGDTAPWRVCLRDTTCDLRNKAVVVNYEEIAFGEFHQVDPLAYHLFRTTDGSFVLAVCSAEQPAAIAFNPTDNSYRYWAESGELNESFKLIRDMRIGPVILNERECVLLIPCGCVLRMQFVPATMKYIAAKEFFRSNPGPLNRLTAAQFRQITGVDMEGHFPSEPTETHHVWIQISGLL